VLHGQGGNDTLTGGDGSDAFVFDTAPVVGRAKHIDRIVDFNGRADKIYLDDTIFKGLSKKVGSLDAPVKIDKKAFWKGQVAHDKDDRIIVKTSGEVLYDVDGTGKAQARSAAYFYSEALAWPGTGESFPLFPGSGNGGNLIWGQTCAELLGPLVPHRLRPQNSPR
jgi:hypothetical protein